MAQYVMGIDVGTTGAKAMVTDLQGNVIGKGYREYQLDYPHKDWVEVRHDYLMEMIFQAVREAVETSGVSPETIEAVSFSLNRSTFCLVDEQMNVIENKHIIWLDARSESVMDDINAKIDADRRNEITGMPGGNIFALTKLYWIKENEPEIYEKAKYFAPLDSVVTWAFGADHFVAEISNASACGLIDVNTHGWSEEIIHSLGFRPEMFPPLVESCQVIGKVNKETAEKTGLAQGCKIVSGSGDQQVSALGAGVIDDGDVSLTIGTFGLLAVGLAQPEFSRFHGMMIPLTPRKGVFQIEGPQVSGATCYGWCRDTFCKEDSQEAEAKGVDVFSLMGERYIQQSVPGSNGVLFYSALFGSGYPTWDTQATGMFLGLHSTTTKADMVRSVMEGITFEARNILESIMETGAEMNEIITVTGGASKSPEWCQIIADVFQRKICTLNVPDSAIIGAAGIAAVGAGLYGSLEEMVEHMVHFGQVIEPERENAPVYDAMFSIYRDAYKGLKQENIFARLCRCREQ